MQEDAERRLAAFEAMLAAVLENYRAASEKMRRLKAAGREKSATYRQLMAAKLQYKAMLSLYEVYGLAKPEPAAPDMAGPQEGV